MDASPHAAALAPIQPGTTPRASRVRLSSGMASEMPSPTAVIEAMATMRESVRGGMTVQL